jgi:hypothetical protein
MKYLNYFKNLMLQIFDRRKQLLLISYKINKSEFFVEYKIGQIFENDYQRHLLKRALIYRD